MFRDFGPLLGCEVGAVVRKIKGCDGEGRTVLVEQRGSDSIGRSGFSWHVCCNTSYLSRLVEFLGSVCAEEESNFFMMVEVVAKV